MTSVRSPLVPVRRAAALAALGFVAACGGGGGDAGSAFVAPSPVAVSAVNQDSVSRAAAASVQGSFVSSIPLAGGGGGALAARRAHAMAAPVARAIEGTAARKRILETLPCAISGTATLTVDDRDRNGTASIGDAIAVAFAACQDVEGETLSGSMGITLTALTTSPRIEFTASTSVSGLRFTSAGLSATYDGGLTLGFAQPSDTVERITVTIGDHLTTSVTTTSYTDTITMLAGHQIVSTYDAVAGLTTGTAAGQVASTTAGGSFTVSTLQPVLQYDADGGFPRSGQMRAAGTTGSVLLTALGNGQVRIDLDANGDGNIDQTKVVEWDWLF